MNRLTVICLAAILASISWGQSPHHTTIVANVSDNPSLAIASFSGSPAARADLESALRSSGWFRILKEGERRAPNVRLDVQFADDGNRYSIQVTGGKEPFTVGSQNRDRKTAAFEATDAILRRLYGVPALCTSRIAYVQHGRNNMKEIFTCWLDGSDPVRLSNNNAISTEPDWGHRGALVYTLAKGNALSIVLVDVKNNRQRVVSRSRGLNSSAALSSDGKSLVLPISEDGRVDLAVRDLVTGKSRRLTNDVSVESSPCWSPDGKSICYVSDRVGKPQLYLIPIAGGQARRLHLGGNECVSPDWSPVSNKICFATRTNSGQYVIAIIDMREQSPNPEIVTVAAGDWEAPSWAPDGRHVVCTRASGRHRDLYVVDTWLKTFRQLTRNGGVSLPAWSPR